VNDLDGSASSGEPVFLIGFMGAGKTTVGRTLARMSGRQFIDLDDVIEQQARMTVRELFAGAGEAEFRRLESEAIKSCKDLKNVVIALGGGAYEAEENRQTLRNIGVTVWIDCPLEICLARIGVDPTRPLIREEREMRLLLDRRRANYALADRRIPAGSLSPEEVALKISELVGFPRLPDIE
jgi:shikimate kinase